MEMPPMIYGTAWKKERTEELVYQALSAGFRAIDTACQPKHYNEKLVGAAITRFLDTGIDRSQILIQTKFTSERGQDPTSIPYDPKASLSEQVQSSFEVSLKNLNTDYLDSWVLHGPLDTFAETMEVWRAMEEIYQQKIVKQLGISNCYDVDYFRRLLMEAKIKPAVIQNRFYHQSGYDVEIRKECRQRGIGYQSFWTLTANPHILSNPSLTAVSRRLGKTPEQIFFCYLIAKGITPLTGTTDLNHMTEDLDVFQFELSSDDVAALDCLVPH